MNDLTELERKYKILGEEIEKLKQENAKKVDDPIFLLSIEEYQKYKENIPKVRDWWWLRSPGSNQTYAADVGYDGSVRYYGNFVNLDYVCVRPALNLHSVSKECYCTNIKYISDDKHRIMFCGVTWCPIAENDALYIAEMPIAYHRFNRSSNNYQTSEIRKLLLDWYNERKHW